MVEDKIIKSLLPVCHSSLWNHPSAIYVIKSGIKDGAQKHPHKGFFPPPKVSLPPWRGISLYFYNAVSKKYNERLHHPHEGFLFPFLYPRCLYHPEEGFHCTFIMHLAKSTMNGSTPLTRDRALLRGVETPSWGGSPRQGGRDHIP